MEITKSDLLELIGKILWIAENQIIPRLTPNEDLAPCLFVTDSQRDIIGVVQLNIPDDYEERFHLDAHLRKRLAEIQAGAYAVTIMGWSLDLTPGQDINSSPRPSEHPDRIETFMILAGSRTAFALKAFRVIRNKDQKISSLENQSMEGAEQHGLFIDMLGTRPKSSPLH